ncbi:MAG: hypothetical protein KAT65_21955 [Methanophagales archaeon]|nr:hypothetical protein [Methanophagales archaeon]
MTEVCPDCGSPVYVYPRLDREKWKRVYEEVCRGCGRKFDVTKEEELTDDELKDYLNKIIDKNKPINISHKRIYDLFYRGEEYDYEFLNYLRAELSKRGELFEKSTIESGFFYVVRNIVVCWEIPKYGNATWFFRGDPTSIMDHAEIYRKSEILNDDLLRETSGFEERAYHDYHNVGEWKTKINEILERIFAE